MSAWIVTVYEDGASVPITKIASFFTFGDAETYAVRKGDWNNPMLFVSAGRTDKRKSGYRPVSRWSAAA